MKRFNQVLSVAISAALAVTTAPWQVYAAPMEGPAYLKTFTPASRLGYMVDHFEGASKQPIILIQDLHANYGVQKKITGLLTSFKSALSVNGQPIILGREAAWTEVDMTPLTSKPVVERNAKAEALLKNAYISAEEYFAVKNEATPTRIMGIENEADFKLHDRLTKASFVARMRLAGKVEHLRAVIEESKRHAPSDLKRVWKAEENYMNGEIGIDELARRLHMQNLDYSSTEKALLDRKMALAENSGKNADFNKNLVEADHYLSLLTRLFRQQMTMEEVSYTYQNSSKILAVVKAMLPDEDLTQWAEVLRSAVDFYAVALMRDKPLAENSMKLAADHADQPIAVITGGFHTDGITKILRSNNISFVVIAPVVESNTLHDEMLYLERSLGVPGNPAAFAADVKAAMTVHTKGIEPNLEGPANPTDIKGPDEKGGVDAMEIASMDAPILEKAPALDVSQADLQGTLNDVLGVAQGFGLFDSATLAKIDFVITPNRTTERTFENPETGKFTVVLDPTQLAEIRDLKAKNGENSPAYINAVNRYVFVAINKARANVAHQNNGEYDTTQDAYTALFGKVSLEAIKSAFEDSHGVTISPYATGVRAIVQAMEAAGVNSLGAQTAWLTNNTGFIRTLVAGAMEYMTKETGITYKDSAAVLGQLQKARGLFNRTLDAFDRDSTAHIQGIMTTASSFFRNSNPNAEQVAELVKSGQAFGTSA